MQFNLNVDQGADYILTIPVLGLGEDDHIDEWDLAGQIRASWAPSAALLDTLTLTGSGAEVTLRIPAAQSTGWTWQLGRYDVEITAPDGTVTRLLEGSVVVHPEITR